MGAADPKSSKKNKYIYTLSIHTGGQTIQIVEDRYTDTGGKIVLKHRLARFLKPLIGGAFLTVSFSRVIRATIQKTIGGGGCTSPAHSRQYITGIYC